MIRPLARRTEPRVVVLRGHQANPWELRPVGAAGRPVRRARPAPDAGWFDTAELDLPVHGPHAARRAADGARSATCRARCRATATSACATRSRARTSCTRRSSATGTRCRRREAASAQLGFKLVLTVWETLPFLDAYRNVRTRPYRRATLDGDRPLPRRDRARARPRCCSRARPPSGSASRRPASTSSASAARGDASAGEHLIVLSPGRLVWEKGHQDVLRAVAALRAAWRRRRRRRRAC